jgi:acetyltransferase-like isoleucine patch superfamily enzyme
MLPVDWFTRDRLPAKYTCGEYSYGHPTVRDWGDGGSLIIGDYCSFADRVEILLGGNHRTEWCSTYPFHAVPQFWGGNEGITGSPWSKGDVVIGSDVWIGHGVTILSGSSIGHGAVIGAGAVVAGRIPNYAVAHGVPARPFRFRFPPGVAAAMVTLAWWDWPPMKVRQHAELLCSADVDALLAIE